MELVCKIASTGLIAGNSHEQKTEKFKTNGQSAAKLFIKKKVQRLFLGKEVHLFNNNLTLNIWKSPEILLYLLSNIKILSMNLNDNSNIPNKPGIYKIINLENNKCYIGSAVNIRTRINKHRYELETNTHNNKYLLRSFKKNGINSFQVEILELFDIINYKKLLKIEEKYIKLYNSLNNGYNLILNNSEHFKNINKSKKHILNNRKNQSISVMCFNRFTGEFVKKFNSITEASQYFNTSSSNISRICKNKLNYIKDHTFCYEKDYDKSKNYSKPHYWSKNKPKSKKHKELLRISSQNRLGKNIYQYDLKWNFIKEYPSRKNAEEMNNLNKESLRKKAGLKTPFEGYYWLYNKI